LIANAYSEYAKHLPVTLASDFLKSLTRYHRVQGSRDLWKSVEELYSIVSKYGFEAKIERVESNTSIGYVESPVSWDPVEAEIVFKSSGRVLAEYSLERHPTLLAAHSPGGEGCGELKICGENPCEAIVALAHGYIYDLYINSSSDLIVYYDESRYHEAFPYIGLFIKQSEIRKRVVMTIPYSIASKLIDAVKVKGRSVEVCWKARVNYHDQGLPVLIACRGSDPGVVFISHICHPKPGAHDNASGSIANLAALHILAKASSEYSYSSCHVWVPEYTGTVILDKLLPWKPLGVINLDMVGSKQHVTGSTAVVVNPPRFMTHNSAAALWIALNKVFSTSKSFNSTPQLSIRLGISPYTIGSDHDVFVAWGFDSTMLNEWPSKYYHTDMDDVNTIDPENVALTGLAAILAGYVFAKSGRVSEVSKLYASTVSNWYRTQAVTTGFTTSYLTRYLIKKPLLSSSVEKPLMKTPLTSRTLYGILGREEFLKVRKIAGALTYLEVYAPLAEILGLKNHLKHFIAENMLKLTGEEVEAITRAWSTVKSHIGI